MREAIEAANLFLAPLDEVRGWWRYHRQVQHFELVVAERGDKARAAAVAVLLASTRASTFG